MSKFASSWRRLQHAVADISFWPKTPMDPPARPVMEYMESRVMLSTYYSAYGQNRTNNVTVTAASHNFQVDGIAVAKNTEWYVNNAYAGSAQNDWSGWVLAIDPEYTRSFSAGTTTEIKALIYDNNWTYQQYHIWNVTVPQPNRAPTQPGSLSSSSITRTSATVSWGASSDPDGNPITYEVQYGRTDVIGDGWTSAGTTTSTSKSITGLQLDTRYTVRVIARDNQGAASAWREQSALFRTQANYAPTTPGTLSASNVNKTSATITWGASSDSNGDTITYEVEYGRTDVWDGWTSAGTTTSTSRNLSGLYSDSRYTVHVRATDSWGGVSGWREVGALFRTLPSNTAPTQPGSLSSSSVARTSATVSWGASSDADGNPITYEVQYGRTDVWDGWTSAGTTTSTSKNLTGLYTDSRYTVRVIARDNQGGESAWREQSALFRTQANYSPTTPATLSPSNVAKTTAIVSWGASSDSNSDTITYEIEYGRTDVWDGWTSAGTTTSTSRNLAGLVADTRYTVRVRATDGWGGISGWREVSALFRTQPLNYAPNQPTNARIDSVTRTSATIRWDASSDGDGDPITYKVQYGKDWSWDGWNPATPLSTTATVLTISGLEHGKTYDVKIWAEDGRAGVSSELVVDKLFTTQTNHAPTTPGMLSASAVGKTSATVSWGASSDSNGDTVTYEVEYGRTDVIGDGWTSAGTTTNTSKNLSGLLSDIRYTVRVRASDGWGGVSGWQQVSALFRTQPLNYSPTSPTNVRVDVVAQTSATIRWDASTDADGDPITYKVQCGKDWSWDGWNPSTPLSTSGTTLTIPGLEEGRTYDVKIWAEDGRGGASSEAVLDKLFATLQFTPQFDDAQIVAGVDNDGDGYKQQFGIAFDVDSNLTGNYYVEIWEDDPSIAGWGDDHIDTTPILTVVGGPDDIYYTHTILTDAHDLGLGKAEFVLKLYSAAATNQLVQTWHKGDDADLGNVAVEFAHQDTTRATVVQHFAQALDKIIDLGPGEAHPLLNFGLSFDIDPLVKAIGRSAILAPPVAAALETIGWALDLANAQVQFGAFLDLADLLTDSSGNAWTQDGEDEYVTIFLTAGASLVNASSRVTDILTDPEIEANFSLVKADCGTAAESYYGEPNLGSATFAEFATQRGPVKTSVGVGLDGVDLGGEIELLPGNWGFEKSVTALSFEFPFLSFDLHQSVLRTITDSTAFKPLFGTMFDILSAAGVNLTLNQPTTYTFADILFNRQAGSPPPTLWRWPAWPATGGQLKDFAGGFDTTGDGIGNGYYPALPVGQAPAATYPYLTGLDIRNSGGEEDDYFVEVKDVPTGWFIEADDGWPSDRKYDVTNLPAGSEAPTRWVIAPSTAASDGVMKFNLYHDRLGFWANEYLSTLEVPVHVASNNTAPTFSGVPDRALDEDASLNDATDLWQYASDTETLDSGLTFSIISNTNPNCGVTLDSNRYIDISPVANWFGTSDVTVQVTDGQLTATDTFRITVNAVNDKPTAAIVSVSPSPAQPPAQSVSLNGSSNDIDGTIVAWEWASNLNGVIGSTEDWSLSSNTLTVGTHTISLRVKDSNNEWSDPATRQLVVNDATPTAVLSGVPGSPVSPGATFPVSLGGHDNDENQQSILAGRLLLDGVIVASPLAGNCIVTAPLGMGSHNLAYQVQDDEGTWSNSVSAVFSVGVTDTTPPKIAALYLRGSTWTTSFMNFLSSSGQGDAALGYSVPVGSGAQMKALPWTNLNRITVVFSEDVIVDKSDLALTGVLVSSYDVAGSTFAYDAANRRATWTLASALGIDKLRFTLNADGASPIQDAAGNRLDGDWINPTNLTDAGTSAFPSGNGSAGGNFAFRFNVAPGDPTGDGVVDGRDYFVIDADFLSGRQDDRRCDFNGDGIINGDDYFLIDRAFMDANQLPLAEATVAPSANAVPAPIAAAAPMPSGGTGAVELRASVFSDGVLIPDTQSPQGTPVSTADDDESLQRLYALGLAANPDELA